MPSRRTRWRATTSSSSRWPRAGSRRRRPPRWRATPRCATRRSAQLLDPMSAALQRVEGQLRDVEKERQRRLRRAARAGRAPCAPAPSSCSGETKSAGQRPARTAGPRAGGASCSSSAWFSSPGWSSTATSPPRSPAAARTAPSGRTWSCTSPGASRSSSTRRCRSRAYLEAVESRDPDTHAERLAAHARQLRAHVDALAAKAYWAAFEPSPEFVVLFVPGDPFLEAALQADPGPAGARVRPQRRHRDAHHADRVAAHRRVRVAAGGAGPQRRGRAPARQGAARPAGDDGHARGEARPQPGRARSTATTRRSRRWRPACWSRRAGSRS